ncbi:hypothetical protein HDU87_005391 [Geranomyces variabilis]|uniref:Uncharacterized protein n=1 Tax=Geranomyces variabilis TaxID=109894 RepID=A0AAD5XL48_9FUNG|nr:hypothetical protein HDU87_005391 [Geranomyces variabilis]
MITAVPRKQQQQQQHRRHRQAQHSPLRPAISHPPPVTIKVTLLCVPYDLEPGGPSPPQTHILLPHALAATTCAELCRYVSLCAVFRPYLTTLTKKHRARRPPAMRVCVPRDGRRRNDRWVEDGMPGSEGEESDTSLEELLRWDDGGTSAGGNALWCVVQMGDEEDRERAGVGQTAGAVITGLKEAFAKSNFRFGSIGRFGSSGKIGVE